MPIERIGESCTGCGACINSCSMDCLRWDSSSGRPAIRYPRDCISCYTCEEDCPVDAIYVSPQRGTTPPPAW